MSDINGILVRHLKPGATRIIIERQPDDTYLATHFEGKHNDSVFAEGETPSQALEALAEELRDLE